MRFKLTMIYWPILSVLLSLVACSGSGSGNISIVESLACPTSTETTFDANYVEFSDDFSGDTLRSDLWGSKGSVSQSNGQVLISKGTSNYHENEIYTLSGFDRSYGDVIIEADITVKNCWWWGITLFYGPNLATTNGAVWLQWRDANGIPTISNGTVTSQASSAMCVPDQPFRFKLTVKSDGSAEGNLYNKAIATNYPSNSIVSLPTGSVTVTGPQRVSISTGKDGSDSVIDNVSIKIVPSSVKMPANVKLIPRDGKVLLQWSNDGARRLVEYKPTGSACDWVAAPTVAPIGSIGYTVPNLNNGQSYDFRIRTQDAASITGPYTAIPSATSDIQFTNHVLGNGQSLSLGEWGGAQSALTTLQPYSNLMLASDSNYFSPLTSPLERQNGQYGAGTNGIYESPASSLYNFISSTLDSKSPYYQGVVSLHGWGGKNYNTIRKGAGQLDSGTDAFSIQNANMLPYTTGMQQLKSASKLSLQILNQPYRMLGVTLVHGEADQVGNTPVSDYTNNLVEMQADYQRDVQARTGQTDTVPLFITQRWGGWCSAVMPSAWPVTDATGSGIAGMARAQWHAGVNNPDKIFVVTPLYFMHATDNCHLQASGYRRMGEYFGKVIKQVVVDKKSWKPLSPKAISLSGDTISIQFYVPVPPLVFDTYLVDEVTNKGFEYFDNSCTSATVTQTYANSQVLNITNNCPITIKSVSLVDKGANTDTIQIKLSASPNLTDEPRVRYAWSASSSTLFGAHTTGVRGNLRDSDSTPALYCDSYVSNDANGVVNGQPQATSKLGCSLYNWGLTFDAPAPSNY